MVAFGNVGDRLSRAYARRVLASPRRYLLLGIILAIIISAVALIAYPIKIDSSGAAFRPRGSHVAEIDDGHRIGEEATIFNPLGTVAVAQQQTDKQDQLTLLLYSSGDTVNIFSDSVLEYLRELEARVINEPGWEDVCLRLLGTTECAPPLSITQYAYAEPNTGCGTFQANGKNPTLSRPINETLLALIDPDEPPSFCGETVNGTCSTQCNTPEPNALDDLVDTDFGYPDGNASLVPNLKAVVSKIDFRFGMPLAGYTSSYDRKAEQQQKIDDFVLKLENFINDLVDSAEQGLEIRYINSALFEKYFDDIIFKDAILVVVSITFVGLYVWFHVGSAFITLFGMFHIILSFPMTYLLMQIFLRAETMGVLNFMSLFIILGIGADDIFIFVDAWKQSAIFVRYPAGHANADELWLEERLSFAYQRSARAMAITSATTSAAFFLNLTSAVPSIQIFGFFTGMMVIFNYLFVVSYFPCAVLVHEKYFSSRSCCCRKKEEKLRLSIAQSDDHAIKEHDQIKTSDLRMLERLFHDYHAVFIQRGRYLIVGAFAILLVISVVYASKLEADDEAARFIPSDDIVFQAIEIANTRFARFPTFPQIFFTLGLRPISRKGSNPYNNNDLGNARFHRNFDPSSEAAQQEIIDLCERLRDEEYVKNREVLCPMDSFKVYVEDVLGTTFPVPQADFLGHLANFTAYYESEFGPAELLVDQDAETREDRDRELAKFGQTIRWRSDASATNLHLGYLAIVVNTTLSNREVPTESRVPYDYWQAVVSRENRNPDMIAASLNYCQQRATGFVWIDMALAETLESSVVTGILLSLLIAFLIMFLMTRDAWLCTLAIFSIGAVVATLIATVYWIGWRLSVIESVCLTILVGLSVDYALHLGNSFREQVQPTRFLKLQAAITEMGISVLSAGITTFLSSFILFFTYILFFVKFGYFIALTVLFATIYSFFFFLACLAISGRVQHAEDIRWIVRTITCGRWCADNGDAASQEPDEEALHDNQTTLRLENTVV